MTFLLISPLLTIRCEPKAPPETPVYVGPNGHVYKLDTTSYSFRLQNKPVSQIISESVINIENHIRKVAEKRGQSSEETSKEIADLSIKYFSKNTTLLTLQTIRNINAMATFILDNTTSDEEN